MSKYTPLWQYIKEQNEDKTILTFAQIEEITSTPIDNSFWAYKKELMDFGYKVEKIKIKEEKIIFAKI